MMQWECALMQELQPERVSGGWLPMSSALRVCMYCSLQSRPVQVAFSCALGLSLKQGLS